MHLIEMVEIDVGVAEGVDKIAGLQPAHLRHHHREQRIGGDVEGYAEEYIRTALVELAGEPPLGHVKLEQRVAGRQGHAVDVGHVPGADDVAARVGVVLQRLHHGRNLVDMPAVGCRPTAPLVAVDGAQFTVGRSPLVPDGHLVVVQVLDVRVACQKPQQFVNDGTQVEFLDGQQRESFVQIETHLITEDALGARSRAVALHSTVGHDLAQQIEILFHTLSFGIGSHSITL